MKSLAPEKTLLAVPNRNGCGCNECPFMKLNTIEKVRNCLRDLSPRIEIEEDLRERALEPLKRMLELS
jgi:quinolinate synthase